MSFKFPQLKRHLELKTRSALRTLKAQGSTKTDNLDIGKKLLAHFVAILLLLLLFCYLLWKNFYFFIFLQIFLSFFASFCFFFVSLDCWYFRLLSFSNFFFILFFSIQQQQQKKTFYFSFQFKQISYSKRNPQQFAGIFI